MTTDHTAIKIRFDPERRRMTGVAAHGDTPFNVPYISQIADKLWTGGCTKGLVLPSYIEHLVSLYPWESYTLKHELRSCLVVRQYDSLDAIDTNQLNMLAEWVNVCRMTGNVLVHCQAGLNRSGLVAAIALMKSGMTSLGAIKLLRDRRSPAVLCNPVFAECVENWD